MLIESDFFATAIVHRLSTMIEDILPPLVFIFFKHFNHSVPLVCRL